jgi:hypothetical protein
MNSQIQRGENSIRFLKAIFLISILALFLPVPAQAIVGKPMIVYSEDETASIQYRQYSSGSWATASTAATTNNKQYWKVAKTHPRGSKKAVISVENPSSGDPYLYASLWDESNWDDGSGSSYGPGFSPGTPPQG